MPQVDDTEFFKQVAVFLESARRYAKRQLDCTIVITYYEVGRMIVEREQRGEKRAKYGAKLIKGLSESNIYASEYSLYLPDKALLQRKLAEWVEAFEKEKIMRNA